MSDEISWVMVTAVKDGQLEAFRTLMEEMVEHTRGESGALIYEWFLSEDESSVHLYERYVDSAATMVHLAGFGEHFAKRFFAAIDPAGMYVYGNATDEVRKALAAGGAVFHAPFGGFAR